MNTPVRRDPRASVSLGQEGRNKTREANESGRDTEAGQRTVAVVALRDSVVGGLRASDTAIGGAIGSVSVQQMDSENGAAK